MLKWRDGRWARAPAQQVPVLAGGGPGAIPAAGGRVGEPHPAASWLLSVCGERWDPRALRCVWEDLNFCARCGGRRALVHPRRGGVRGVTQRPNGSRGFAGRGGVRGHSAV